MEMKFSPEGRKIAPRAPDDVMAAPSLHGHVLRRLITFCFGSAHGPAYTFEETFRAFAKAYFSVSLEIGDLRGGPAARERAVDVLAQVFEEAVAAGHLAPLSVSTRLGAATVLTSLASLQQQVTRGLLSPAEAADLVTDVGFNGLQASQQPAKPLASTTEATS